MLHSLAELTIIKDETVSLEEKQNQLTDIAKSVGSNCENIAFYDAQGNAVIGDGRTMNFAELKTVRESINTIASGNADLTQADSVQETAGAVNQISSNIESLERMIESQATCVTEASASIEQMIGNINSVNFQRFLAKLLIISNRLDLKSTYLRFDNLFL